MASLGMGDVSVCVVFAIYCKYIGIYLARKQSGVSNVLWKTMKEVKTFLVVVSCDFSGIL